nr:DUF4158 domain-containing protein [Sphingobium sp. IP1]
MSLEIWARHYGAPLDEREIARHYTLTSDDLEIVGRRRGDATRLGYAMLMLYMRWPGRALEAGEVPPAPVLAYVAQQLGVAPAAFADYAHRDQTRREHLVEIRRSHGFRIFDRNAFREVVASCCLTEDCYRVERLQDAPHHHPPRRVVMWRGSSSSPRQG